MPSDDYDLSKLPEKVQRILQAVERRKKRSRVYSANLRDKRKRDLKHRKKALVAIERPAGMAKEVIDAFRARAAHLAEAMHEEWCRTAGDPMIRAGQPSSGSMALASPSPSLGAASPPTAPPPKALSNPPTADSRLPPIRPSATTSATPLATGTRPPPPAPPTQPGGNGPSALEAARSAGPAEQPPATAGVR